MPKKAYLANHLEPNEIKQKYITNLDPVEARRWHVIWLVALGWTIKDSAIVVGLDYEYVKKILKRYNELGIEGVKNKRKVSQTHVRGKAALLNQEQLQKLLTQLRSRPSDGGIWTGPKVARWIEKETYREKVANQRGWDYLKKCNYSWQQPRPKHRACDEKAQEEFKVELPLKVKQLQQQYPGAQIEVWFFDEHRVGLKPILRKVWSPIGARPIAVVQHRYEWVYVYGFVEPKTGRTYWYLIPRVNTKWLNLVLTTFATEVGAGDQKIILLVQDRAGWHTSTKVELPTAIICELLPPYSPELQPAERLWSLVDEPLVNEHFESINELEDVLAARCCVLQQMNDEIRNLTNYHWFNYD
ncbi:IS630 family transposase [Coleofasciculus sp. FACHB-64]|nr:IS630 family transposase [Coleofasciculus sp. FACHB-64]MBD2046363.1 IS630 family transposase [Coleofasciculus sp. FACHB-64]MBD2087888.1 IS630 family transposase [Coleofasciculus sp. FACHB-542]